MSQEQMANVCRQKELQNQKNMEETKNIVTEIKNALKGRAHRLRIAEKESLI